MRGKLAVAGAAVGLGVGDVRGVRGKRIRDGNVSDQLPDLGLGEDPRRGDEAVPASDVHQSSRRSTRRRSP